MHPGERRGAHAPGRMADWDLVRVFLEVAWFGSIRAAAEQLRVSANFLSKRVSMLVPALCDPLLRLDINVRFEFDVRLAYRPDAKTIARVKRVIDATVQSFDGCKYPWFGVGFVHSRDLQGGCNDAKPLVDVFAGLKQVSRPKLVRFPNRANGSTR